MHARGNCARMHASVQDIEFTVQDGRLFMLQTRNGKRTGLAALQVAVDMVRWARGPYMRYDPAVR